MRNRSNGCTRKRTQQITEELSHQNVAIREVSSIKQVDYELQEIVAVICGWGRNRTNEAVRMRERSEQRHTERCADFCKRVTRVRLERQSAHLRGQ
jgi:hypothetical protein